MTTFNSSYNETYPFSDMAPQFGLAAATELTYTVPGTGKDKYQVRFSWPYNANVWVAYNRTATLPALNVMADSARCELNPDKRYVKGGDVIHFISTGAVTDAGMVLLQIPN